MERKYGGYNGTIWDIRWKYGVFNETYMGYMEIIEQLGTMMKYGS